MLFIATARIFFFFCYTNRLRVCFVKNDHGWINFAISDMTPRTKVTSLGIDPEKQSHKMIYTLTPMSRVVCCIPSSVCGPILSIASSLSVWFVDCFQGQSIVSLSVMLYRLCVCE